MCASKKNRNKLRSGVLAQACETSSVRIEESAERIVNPTKKGAADGFCLSWEKRKCVDCNEGVQLYKMMRSYRVDEMMTDDEGSTSHPLHRCLPCEVQKRRNHDWLWHYPESTKKERHPRRLSRIKPRSHTSYTPTALLTCC